MSKFYLNNLVYGLALEMAYQDCLKQHYILESNKNYKSLQIIYSPMKNINLLN